MLNLYTLSSIKYNRYTKIKVSITKYRENKVEKKKSKAVKIKRIIGFTLTALIAIGCLFLIFLIDAQVEGNERKRWVFRFLQTII